MENSQLFVKISANCLSLKDFKKMEDNYKTPAQFRPIPEASRIKISQILDIDSDALREMDLNLRVALVQEQVEKQVAAYNLDNSTDKVVAGVELIDGFVDDECLKTGVKVSVFLKDREDGNS